MAKIKVNHDDCYFENKSTFDELVNKAKALGASIKRNGGELIVTGAMVGCVLFSACCLPKAVKSVFDIIDYVSETFDNSKLSSSNGESIKELDKIFILASNIVSSEEASYHIEEDQLLDRDGNLKSLRGEETPIALIGCKLNDQTFENIELASSKTKLVCLNFSTIDNNFINYLPDTVEELVLDGCRYINNLDELPDKCPNITGLSLSLIPNLSDLSFIYRLHNLKELYIEESAYVTEELLDYLIDNGITTNLSEKDIVNAKKIDEIVESIIKPEMSDREKIQSVCLYVLNNFKYDIKQSAESNESPISCFLDDGKGVCASYAYFSSILLNKAGVCAFEITNDGHGWNMVKLDDKYYYLDTTNMDGSAFYNFLLKTLNISKYYMVDTNVSFASPMTSPENEKTKIPLALIEDIQKGRDEKTFIEKYGAFPSDIIAALISFLVGGSVIIFPKSLIYCIEEIPFLFSCINDDYKRAYDYYSCGKSK